MKIAKFLKRHQLKIIATFVILLLIFFVCENNNNEIYIGKRDHNGCLPSAGYSWCERKKKCIRPWEESC